MKDKYWLVMSRKTNRVIAASDDERVAKDFAEKHDYHFHRIPHNRSEIPKRTRMLRQGDS